MRRVLVANRGEIACRVFRSCRALGLETAAVYSAADAGALHVALADASREIGPGPARESYLRPERVLAAARELKADAVHPGYGFLAESPGFAREVIRAGLVWIGPLPDSIEAMGDKERARAIAAAAGVPVLPGSRRFPSHDTGGLDEAATAVGYPLLVKAAAGGGGIGMRRVNHASELRAVVETTQTMAARSFGDGTVYFERFVPRARHVEVQVFGTGNGGAVHLYERDCSLQRRFQKVVEESPAPGLPEDTRRRMLDCATALARLQAYSGAGTVEFIVDAETFDFFFLEMNTRIQVEHPVTEAVIGLDLVAMQIEQARGTLDSLVQHAVVARGHALECRLYAEDPSRNFLPSPGKLSRFSFPEGVPHIRVDTGVREGDSITFYYDPMIAKLIAWGETQHAAIRRMREALNACRVEGIRTNLDFLRRLIVHAPFADGAVHTSFIDEHLVDLLDAPRAELGAS